MSHAPAPADTGLTTKAPMMCPCERATLTRTVSTLRYCCCVGRGVESRAAFAWIPARCNISTSHDDLPPTVIAHAVRRAAAQMHALRLLRLHEMFAMCAFAASPYQRCFLPRHFAQAQKLWRRAWAAAACAALCSLLAMMPHRLANMSSDEIVPLHTHTTAAVFSVALRHDLYCDQSFAGVVSEE